MKSYPLEVESISEFEGGSYPIFYRSKGHHSPEEFLRALMEYYEDSSELYKRIQGPPEFTAEDVKQIYQRNIGVAGMKGVTTIHDAKGPARGAYPVTLVYC